MLSTVDKAMFLKHIDVFAKVKVEDLLRIAALSTEACFVAGQTVFSEGEAGDSLYFVIEGRVELGAAGRPVVTLTALGSFGAYALLTGAPRYFTAVALTDTCALRLGSQEFMDMLADDPAIAVGMLRHMALKAMDGLA